MKKIKDKDKDKDIINLGFPVVKNVPAKTLAEDLISFDPSNKNDIENWKQSQIELWSKVKKSFDEKGIPFPEIVFDISKKPISEKDHPLLRKLK